jgi:hypothetical protein
MGRSSAPFANVSAESGGDVAWVVEAALSLLVLRVEPEGTDHARTEQDATASSIAAAKSARARWSRRPQDLGRSEAIGQSVVQPSRKMSGIVTEPDEMPEEGGTVSDTSTPTPDSSGMDTPASAAGSDGTKSDTPAPTADSASPARDSVRPAQRQFVLSSRVNLWSTVLTALAAVVALILSSYSVYESHARAEASVIMPNIVRAYTGNVKGGSPPFVRFIVALAFTVDRKSDVQTLVSGAWLEASSPQISVKNVPIAGAWMGMVEVQPSEQAGAIGVPKYVGDADPIRVSTESTLNQFMMFQVIFPDDSAPHFAPGRWDIKISVFPFHQDPIVLNTCLQATEYSATTLNGGLIDGKGSPLVGFYKNSSPMADDWDTSCYVSG